MPLQSEDGLRPVKRVPGPPRGSHVIPSRLLAQFGELSDGTRNVSDLRHVKAWRYSLTAETKQMAVSNFRENDFYAYRETDGSRNDRHERRMAQEIEGPFNALLHLFESDLYVPNRAHGLVIARYVSNLFNRTHQRRNASKFSQAETARIARALVQDRASVLQLTAAYSLLMQRPFSIHEVVRGTSSLYTGAQSQRTPSFSATFSVTRNLFLRYCEASRTGSSVLL